MKPTILIVDAELEGKFSLMDWLELENYNLINVTDSWLCLQFAKEKRPDLIIWDVNAIDFEMNIAISKIIEDFKIAHIPVMFMTGELEGQTIQQKRRSQSSTYLKKPLDLSQLLKAIADVLKDEKSALVTI